MMTPRWLKCDVSNNFPYKFLEEKNNFEKTDEFEKTRKQRSDGLSECPYHQWTRKKTKKRNHTQKQRREGRAHQEQGRACETSTEQMDTSFDFTPRKPRGRGGQKLVPSWSPKSPGERNLKLHVDRMTEQQLKEAKKT